MSTRGRKVGLLAVMVAVVLGTAALAAAQTRPALTRDVDNGDRQPIFRDQLTVLLFEPMQGNEECLPAVGAGRRVVIEHVTARVSVRPGQAIWAGVKIGGTFVSFLPLVYQGPQDATDIFVAAVTAPLRVNAGSRLCVYVSREPGVGQATGQFWLSGYTLDVP